LSIKTDTIIKLENAVNVVSSMDGTAARLCKRKRVRKEGKKGGREEGRKERTKERKKKEKIKKE
jgi:hypothetical protein